MQNRNQRINADLHYLTFKKRSKTSTHLVAQKLTYGKTISFFYRLLIDQSTHLCELEKKEDYCSDVCDIYFPTA